MLLPVPAPQPALPCEGPSVPSVAQTTVLPRGHAVGQVVWPSPEPVYSPDMDTAARRAVLGGLLAGGAVVAGAAPAQAADFSARTLPARKLKPGDLVVGPDSTVVRVAQRTRLPGGRHRVRFTHPHTGAPTPVTEAIDAKGYAAKQPFVVLLRRVPVAAVVLSPIPPPTDPDVIDGGRP